MEVGRLEVGRLEGSRGFVISPVDDKNVESDDDDKDYESEREIAGWHPSGTFWWRGVVMTFLPPDGIPTTLPTSCWNGRINLSLLYTAVLLLLLCSDMATLTTLVPY